MPRHSICLRLHGNAIVVRAVVRFVFKVAERECPCAEAVLLRFRFACDHRALEVGVLLDVDIEAAFSCEKTRLIPCAAVVGFQASLADRCTDRGLGEGAEDFVGTGRVEHLVHAPREVEARRCVLLLVGFFFLQGFDREIASDVRLDLFAFGFASEDVRILAAFQLERSCGFHFCGSVGRAAFLALSFGAARA